MISDICKQTRTFRRFDASFKVEDDVLQSLVNLGRLAGSARNVQPWQYILVNDQDNCNAVFPHLRWAGYLADWAGPEKGEEPTGYILCILNKNWWKGSMKEAWFDLGIASQNMLMGASELGFGGCRIASFTKELASLFPLEEYHSLELVIALGKPVEKVKMVDGLPAGNVKYWRDGDDVHHVPKRVLEDIVLSFR